MKVFLLFFLGVFPMEIKKTNGIQKDEFQTSSGKFSVYFLGHASLFFTYNDQVIYVDPCSQYGDYSSLPKATLILITHHHFDHAGGIFPLIEFLKSKNSNIEIWTTEEMYTLIQNPASYIEKAKKGFKDVVGDLTEIPERFFSIQSSDSFLDLSDEFKIKMLRTPGHCNDHISPIIVNSFNDKICFLGEAFGINLKSDLFPIPASSAPAFNSTLYRNSIAKLLEMAPDIAIFSHFGGIQGKQNIKNTGENALFMLDSFQSFIRDSYCESGKTQDVVQCIYEKYEDTIATLSLDKELSKDLAFTIVYGCMQDMGLKARK